MSYLKEDKYFRENSDGIRKILFLPIVRHKIRGRWRG
jgi:hypothetical protein